MRCLHKEHTQLLAHGRSSKISVYSSDVHAVIVTVIITITITGRG
jgi:hypothetical protein